MSLRLGSSTSAPSMPEIRQQRSDWAKRSTPRSSLRLNCGVCVAIRRPQLNGTRARELGASEADTLVTSIERK